MGGVVDCYGEFQGVSNLFFPTSRGYLHTVSHATLGMILSYPHLTIKFFTDFTCAWKYSIFSCECPLKHALFKLVGAPLGWV